MTLTKKRWLLAAVPLLLLCLILLPQVAKADAQQPPVPQIFITSPTTATIVCTKPAAEVGTSYTAAITNGAIVTDPGAAGGTYEISMASFPCTLTITADDGGVPAARSAVISTGAAPYTISLTGPVSSINITTVAQTYLGGGSGTIPFATLPFQAYHGGSIAFNAAVAPGVFSSGLMLTLTSGGGNFSWNGTTCSLTNITSNASINITGITQWGNYPNWYGNGYGYGYDYTYYANASTSSYSGNETVSFTINASIYDLNRVGVDRMLLNSGTHYTATSVSGNKTQITFTKSFLNSLSRGQHDFYFNFLYGSATARLNVLSTGSGSTGTGGTGIPSGSAQALRALTVYNKASTKGKKLGNVAKGTGMVVTGFTASGSYATINYGNQEGYVNANYINANLSEEITGRLSSTTYLYTQKSTNAKYRFVKASKNTPVTLLAREGTYWKVNYNGDVLYIRAASIKNITVG